MPSRSIKQLHITAIFHNKSLYTPAGQQTSATACCTCLDSCFGNASKKNLCDYHSQKKDNWSKELGRVACSGLLTQAASAGSCGNVPLCSVQIALPPIRNRFAAYSPRNSAPKQKPVGTAAGKLQTIPTMAAVCCVYSNAMQLDPLDIWANIDLASYLALAFVTSQPGNEISLFMSDWHNLDESMKSAPRPDYRVTNAQDECYDSQDDLKSNSKSDTSQHLYR